MRADRSAATGLDVSRLARSFPRMWSAESRDVARTRSLGRALARVATPGTVLALTGDLGAGKTAFVQGIGEGLAVEGPVVSPTFVLVAEHAGRLPLLHADLYRLEPAELPGLGLEEALERWEGVAAVEWSERAPEIFPADHLRVEIAVLDENRRRFTLTAGGPRHLPLLDHLVSGPPVATGGLPPPVPPAPPGSGESPPPPSA